MKLKAIVHKAEEGGYWAEVPAVPGCVTQGETLAELRANLREAIEGCLSVDCTEQRIDAHDQGLMRAQPLGEVVDRIKAR
jgi:predicted RNase H-like HicB family nuclease